MKPLKPLETIWEDSSGSAKRREMPATASTAPIRILCAVVCILLLSLGMLAVRQFAIDLADGFLGIDFLSGGSVVRRKGTYASREHVIHKVPREGAREGGEKFIWPLLSDKVGTGNQLMEYISAAVVAHGLNRTLCLTPFQDGPANHRGNLWHPGHGLALEERYNMERLSKFVKIASVDQCLTSCNHTLDDTWLLRGSRPSPELHFDQASNAIWSEGKDMDWSFVRWTTTEDVRKALGQSNLSCVALGGLFPGLRWRGAYLAASAYLTASPSLAHSARVIRNRIIGDDTRYLAVHWRFEESFCGGRGLGSCFLRCGDGAIINTGLHPSARAWIDQSSKMCHFHGVKVAKEDVVGAIYDRAYEGNLTTVYLATDGWIRGQEGANLIKDVVEMLREENIMVVGLWRINGLPNFSDGEFIPDGDSPELAEFFGLHDPEYEVNSRMIAGVEQELCTRAEVFLGSGQSSWSLAVFRSRLAQRRARQILKSFNSRDLTEAEVQQLDQTVHDQIIHELLSDEHEAGLLCGYHKYYERFPFNATKETAEDEAPDGWLDLEACEMRIGHKGGQCEFATCTS